MNIVIDIGNTRFKVGIFDGKALKEKHSFKTKDELFLFLNQRSFKNAIVSSVGISGDEVADRVNAIDMRITLSHLLPLPITIRYTTPHTLGVDRIAAACGAWEMFPNQNSLVIDAGTCITYDWVDGEGNYFGGSISPGLEMRLRAMHTFTARLPLVNVNREVALVGDSTEHALQSGAWHGLLAEVDGIIDRYQQQQGAMQVIVGGGDALFFENRLKHTIFAAPELVLIGLNRILLHNAD
ncbi:MAG: type III pantothenate kinase [Bacteroidetes bacterium]|nr:type III pantothenate kinase [Bacteroidota bacterium]